MGCGSAAWRAGLRLGLRSRPAPLHAEISSARPRSGARYRWASGVLAGAASLLLGTALPVPATPGPPELPAPLPEHSCPEGTELHVGHGFDSQSDERLWMECRARDEEGFPVRQGPTSTYAVERREGKVSFRPVEMVEYRVGTLHGLHRRWSGPDRHVLEESFLDGAVQGVSRSWYESGELLEVRHFRNGQLHGDRHAWYPTGEERWTAEYEDGQLVSFHGERSVAGEPCPEGSVPTASPDGLEEFCERGGGRWRDRHGPYVIWSAEGEIVERGVFRHGQKAEVWEAPPGAPPSPAELTGVLVTEVWLTASSADLTAVAGTDPHHWVRDLANGDFVYPEVEIDGARIALRGLPPGSYALFLRIDTEPSNPEYYPGDLGGDVRFDVATGEVARLELDLDRILHLTEPFDNGTTIRGMDLPCAEQPLLASPTRFAWEPPVPPAPDVEYHYRIARVACDPFRELGVAVEGSTGGTAVELHLAPSRPDEAYHFRLYATSGGETVGFITSHGPRNTQGWHVGFRIGG